jgi:hypothetical protein
MTTQKKIQKLNDIYADCFTDEQAFNELIYLTSKQRDKRTTESHLRKVIANREVGRLIKRLDPVLFHVSPTYS